MTDIVDPATAAERMFEYDPALTERFLELFRERLANTEPSIGYGSARTPDPTMLDGLIGEAGTDPERVLKVFADALAPAVLVTDSPADIAYVPHAPTQAARLFDMFVACASFPGTHWFEGAGVILAENQALRVLADLAGLPESAGGCFVSGGSIGNLSALYVARERHRDRTNCPKIALTAETHVSAALALRVLGVEGVEVPTEDHRLTGESLRAALDASPDAEDVVGVVATAGTTNAGIVDDLAGVVEVARERDIWVHVDAAYGGAGLLAPSVRDKFRGLGGVDSLVIDPHKWLFTSYDCGALLYREPEYARAALTQDASYLEVLKTGAQLEWNPGDYAFHLTRRVRGLPLWFSLAVNGLAAYRETVEYAISLARSCATAVAERPYLELIRDPELSVVLFRRRNWAWLDYQQWSARLLSEQRAHVAPTSWEGQPAARFGFGHPYTSLAFVESVLDSMA
jgi:aromatic-L-amino-acid/L-tryptophan decarboxylase